MGLKNGENYAQGDPGLGFTAKISDLGAGGIASVVSQKFLYNDRPCR